jgi:hypothetical protein
MDHELLKLLAHFKILLKKERGVQVDVEKLLHDAAYGRQMLAVAEETQSEALVLLALTIRDKFGHLDVAPAPRAAEESAAMPGRKYVHGARS